MEDLYIERWNQLLTQQSHPWVLFAHGTCVVLTQPGEDLAQQTINQQAINLIEQWPVHAGSELGDFNVIALVDAPGWVVTCAHPDILTYLAPEEVSANETSELAIGLHGRSKRDQDAHEKRVIFVKENQ